MSVDGQIRQTTYYGTSSGGGARYVEELFDASSLPDELGIGHNQYTPSSPTKDNNKMKKSNKKNIWVPGKPMTPKAREMLESGKGAMNSDGRWTCLECNRSLSNEWTLEQHIQTVHGARTFSCDKCNKKFKRRDHLLNHEKTIHKGLKPCKRCNVTFNNREELRQHKLKVHYKPLPDGTMPPIPRYLTQPIEDEPTVISPPIRSPPPQPQSQSYQIVTPATQTILQDASQSQSGQTLIATNTPITTTQQIVIQPLPTNRTSEISQSFSQTITIPRLVQPNINIVNPIVQNPAMHSTPISRRDLKNSKGRKWRRSFGSIGQEDEFDDDGLLDDGKTHCDVFGCDKEFNTIDNFNNHWQLIHEENRCQLCKQLFSGSRSMKVHGSVHEAAKCTLNAGNENQIVTEGFKCWFCPGVFRIKDTLLDHVDAFHVGCVCLECGSCLLGSEQCGDHIADQHPPQKVLEEDQDRCHYQCSACFHVFTKRIEAERHFVEQHFVAENEKAFDCCPYCPDVFQSYVRLNDHIQWEHGLEEIDENAVVVKNRESQQFFQCEICDHFFQTESILDKHIKGHQVDKVARYKVIPHRHSSSAKRKRKHSKKQKKKSDKWEKRHSSGSNSGQRSKESVDIINANEDEAMDSELVHNGEITNESEISNITTKPLPVEHGNIQPQVKCQSPNALLVDSNDKESKLNVADLSTMDTSMSTSPTKLQEMDSVISANPEIEQAVASICGPNIAEIDNHLNSNETEGLNTENTAALPLTGGTLEIENAVNSILGDESHINDTTVENAIIFDIKRNDEDTSLKSMEVIAQEAESTNDLLLEKDSLGNGLVEEKEINDIPKSQKMSENIGITIDKNNMIGNQLEANDIARENNVSVHIPSMKNYQTEVFTLPEKEPIVRNSVVSAYSIEQAQNVYSGQDLNGLDKNLPEKDKTAISGSNQTEQHSESLVMKDLSTHELPSLSSKAAPNFDVSHSQFLGTNDTLEKVSYPTKDVDSTIVLPLTHSTDINSSKIRNINNGDISNH